MSGPCSLPAASGRPRRRPPSRLRLPAVLGCVAALLTGAASAAPASAQWPAEVAGRVVDATSGVPVEGAAVEVVGSERAAMTDGAGRFRLRGLEPGRVVLRVERLGYGSRQVETLLANGRTRHLRVALSPVPLALEPMTAEGRRAAGRLPGGGVRIDRAAVERSGAATVGEVLDALPGVVVTRRGVGGPETVSVRGSSPDGVLVLLDGAPLNDPVTGTADVSTVTADAVEEIVVLPGGRAARFGGRARAGVVVIRTRAPVAGLSGRVGGGSLGRRAAGLDAGAGGRGGPRWGIGVETEVVDGGFGFRQPESVGGGRDRRRNADLSRWSARGSGEGQAAGGRWTARVGLEAVERGLPGRSFAPSDSARQDVERLRAALRWERTLPGGRRLDLSAYSTLNRSRFRDPAPPLGLPYDHRTRVSFTGLWATVADGLGPSGGDGIVVAGLELRRAGVRAEGLSDGAPASWLDGGVFARTSLRWPGAPAAPEVGGALRIDRDGPGRAWHLAHELSLGARVGAVSLHAAHRSAFSAPSLGDHFFREGVGVEPNPDLRGERVPSEIEAGVELELRGARLGGAAGATVYAADVRDKIVWAPDFRFVWSPRNVDVERSGVEAWAEVGLGVGARSRLGVEGHYALARVTYADPARRGLQLRYRPRHTGRARLAFQSPSASVAVVARYIGARLPTPSAANELPPFWTVALRAERAWTWSRWTLRTRVDVERLLNRGDALIFAYPEPGRTLEVGVRVERGRPDQPQHGVTDAPP